jgi:hypothetical protein
MILAHAAIAGFGRGMGVDVHQAGQGEQAFAVDHLFGGAAWPRARRRDLGDLAVLQVQVDFPAIDMAPFGAVANDGPGHIANGLRSSRHCDSP